MIHHNLELVYLLFTPIPVELILLETWVKNSRIAKILYLTLACNILLAATIISLTVYTTLTTIWDYPTWEYITLIVLPLSLTTYVLYVILEFAPKPSQIFGQNFINKIWENHNPEKILEKKGQHIFLAWLLFTTLFLAWRYGIISSGVITTDDHPYHYYQAWYTAEYLIPVFHNAIGWSPYFYAGYPIMYHYFPGSALIISLIHVGSLGFVSVATAYRIFFLLALLVAPISTYVLAKELRLKNTESAVIGLLSVVPTFRHIETLYWGMTSSVFAAGLSPLVFAFLHRYHKTKQLKQLISASLVFTIILLTHSIVAIGVAVGITAYLALTKNTNKQTILVILATPLLLSAFWIIPSAVYYVSGYGSLRTEIPFAVVKTILGFINYHLYLLFGIPLVLIPFAYAGYKRCMADENCSIKFLSIYPLLLYVISFYGSAIPYLQTLQLMHLMPLLGMYIVIVAGLGISMNLKNRFGEITAIALCLAIMSPILGTLPLNFSLTKVITNEKSVMNEDNILAVGLPQDVEQTLEWIKLNAEGRVLVEDTNIFPKNSPWGSGYSTALGPIYAENVKFIGGPLPYYNPFWTGNKTNTGEGVILDMQIESMNYKTLTDGLNKLNIEYLVLWSNKSKNFFNRKEDFQKVKEAGNFSIYRYKNNQNSFIVKTEGTAKASITNFGVKTISLRVKTNETSKITLSSSYFPNWHAYANGKRIPLDRDDIFLQVTAPPEDEPYEITVRFEENKTEAYSKWLSITSWIAALTLIIFHKNK